MKAIGVCFFTSVFLILIALPLWAQPHPHPYRDPMINFQGRIEEGDIGYTGSATFRFWIGDDDMGNIYWGPKDAQTNVVEGIYNVIIGRDTDPLTAGLFTGEDSYYLQVAFSTDGSYFETLEPTQEILTVPFAVNAHLLDGLGAPQSAFVGLTDVQTIEGKTMLDTILTRPVIDSSYFILTPGTVPDDPALGYLAFDDDGDVLKYWDGTAWVPVGVSPEDSPWYRDGTIIRPRTTGDFVQLTGTSRFWFSRTAQGSAASPLISFNPEDGGTGIYSTGDHQIDFSTQSERRFSIRRHGFALFEPITHLESGDGTQGGLYFNQQTNTFMYHDGTRWQPIATGEGSIPKPDGQYYTLFATDGTTWASNRELRIYPGSRVATWNDLQVGSVASVHPKLYFGGAAGTNFTYFTGGTLVLSNAASHTLTFTHNNRLRLAHAGTRNVPALSFGDQTDLGIYVDDEDKHISFVSDQTDMFSIRGEGHVRFRPIGHPAPDNARPGDLYFNNQTGSFMYYWAGAWRPIASGEGSIPKPDNEYDTLYAVDGDTWAPTDELHIRPADGYVRTKRSLRVGQGGETDQRLTFANVNTGFVYPGGNVLEFWTNDTRQVTLTDSGHMRLRHGGSVSTPVISLGNETDTGIYHFGTNSIGFTIGGDRLFALRSGLYTVHEPLQEDPATSHAGGLYFNQQSGTFMYAKVDSGDWYPIATGEGSIPSPNAEHDILYASDSDTWTPTNELRVYPGERVSTYNDLQVGRAGYMDAKIHFRDATTSYITAPHARIYEFYLGGDRILRIRGTGGSPALPALSSTVNPPVTFFTESSGIFRPTADNHGLGIATQGVEALRIRANQQVGIGTGSTTDARLHVTVDSEADAQKAFQVRQEHDEEAVYIDQRGAETALWISQNATTGAGAPSTSTGGALHVNMADAAATGSAITAYSIRNPVAPLAWLKVEDAYSGMPVLRLEGRSSHASPLHLVAQANPPDSPLAGEIYMDTDTFLYYYNGTEWIPLGGGLTGSGAHGQVTFWDSANSLTGDSAFYWDTENKRLGLGTSAPDLRLDVRGTHPDSTDASQDILRIASTSTDPLQLRLGLKTGSTASRYGYIDVEDDGSGRHLVLQKDGGNVGIRTDSPVNILTVRQPGITDTTMPATFENFTTGNMVTGLDFRVHTTGSNNRKGAVIYERTGSGGRGSIHLATTDTTDGTNVSKSDARLTVTSAGNVGIGTTAPVAGSLLDVEGKIAMRDGTQSAGYILTSDSAGLASWTDIGEIAGDITGSGAEDRVTFWTGEKTVGSDENFTFADSLLTVPHGTFTGLTASVVEVSGGTIDGTSIGQTSHSLGRFTHLTGATSLTAGNLTDGRVTYAGPGGVLTDDGSFTFDGTVLGATGGSFTTLTGTSLASNLTAGSVIFAGAGGVLTQDNTNLFWDNNNNRLGIGIATPLAQLHTTGTVRFAGGDPGIGKVLTSDADGTATWEDPATGFVTGTGIEGRVAYWTSETDIDAAAVFAYDDENDRVGIGTTEPVSLLHVEQDATPFDGFGSPANYHLALRKTSTKALSEVGPGLSFVSQYDANPNNVGAAIVYNQFQTGGRGALQFYLKSDATHGNPPALGMSIDMAGRLGIGTFALSTEVNTLPYAITLTSHSDANRRTVGLSRTATDAPGRGLILQAGGAFSGGENKGGGTLFLDGGTSTGTGTSKIELRTATAGSAGTDDNTPTTKMTVLGSGNVGINTGSPSARLHVDQTASANAFRIDQRTDNYAAYIRQTGAKSALWIEQRESTGADEPSNLQGGALHVWNVGDAFGSAISAFSNIGADAVAPLVWFRGGSDFDRQPVLRLQGHTGKAAPLHLVPMAKPAPGGTWDSYTGAFYVALDGTLYFNNGTDWQALPGDAGDVSGSGSPDRVAFWTDTDTISGEAGFEYADSRLTAPHATFTGLTASQIDAFTLAGTLTGGAQTISGTAFEIGGGTIDSTTIGQTGAALGRFSHLTAVDSLTSANLTSGSVIFAGAGGVLSQDNTNLFWDNTENRLGIGIATPLAQLHTTGTIRFAGAGSPGAGKVLTASDATGLATWQDPAGDVSGSGVDGRVAFWTGEKELGSDADFTFDGTVLSAPTGTFSTLTSSLDPGRIVYTGPGGLLTVDSALAFDDTGETVTLDSGVTDGTAMEIKADDLTTGTALDVSSTADDTNYDLVKFSAQTGRALVINHSGGGTGAGNETVYIERDSNGRVLGVSSAATSQNPVWFASNTLTTGNLLNVRANSPDMTGSGYVIHAYQLNVNAGGHALVGQQKGRGNALRAIVESGAPDGAKAGFFQQGANSDSTIDGSSGGAVHILNSDNIYGALTVYSNQGADQAAPLSTIKSTSIHFDHPLLRLEPTVGGNAPHLWLRPIDGPEPEGGAQAGMLYASTDTNALMYYNGTSWIALTGDSGGAEDFATRELDNLQNVAINADLLPDGNNTRDLGSAALSWGDIHADGTSYLATVDIDGGTIDDTEIGTTTPSYGAFTEVKADFVRLGESGTATTPALSWDNDKNTGIYRIAANTIGFSTEGTLEATLTSGGRWNMRASGTEGAPAITLGGGAHNTGIYRTTGDHLNFSNAGSRGFAMRADKVFHLVGAAADPGNTEGGLFYNTDTKSLKYNDGSRWITLTGPDPSLVSGEGDAGQVTFWGSDNQITGDDDLFWSDNLLEVRGAVAKTTTPVQDVDVLSLGSSGATPMELLFGYGTGGTGVRHGYINVDDQGTARSLVLQKGGGNVGIGTDSPVNILTVRQPSITEATMPATFENFTTGYMVTGLDFRVHTSGSNNRKGAVIFERTGAGGTGSIHLATRAATDTSNVSKDDARLTVTRDGKVGIGTTDPDEALSVAGRAWLQQTDAPATTADRLYNVDGDLHWAGEQLSRWSYRDMVSRDDVNEFTVANTPVNAHAFRVGTPIRYRDGGDWLYGMVVAYSGGEVELAGAPLPADPDELQTGSPDMLRQVNFYKPGDIEEGEDDFMGLSTWQMGRGYVVRATGQLEEEAGGEDAMIQFALRNTTTDLLTAALNLNQSDDEVDSNTSVNTSNYHIELGNRIYVKIAQAGTTAPGSGLLATLQVVVP